MAAKNASPVLQLLELEYTEGGSSPWFTKKGRDFVSGLTEPPDDANLFGVLARDGTMGALIGFLNEEQPSLNTVSTVSYILLGFVLLYLFLLLPLAACLLRRAAARVGLITWLICEVILVVAAAIQTICLLSMISTYSAMGDGLTKSAPLAFEWAFALLLNYTVVATNQLKKTHPNQTDALDKAQAATTNSLSWLRGNISAWENEYEGYASLTHMVTGMPTLLPMVLLGIGLAVAVSAALFACGAWKRRQKALAKGRRSPVFVALVNMAGAVLLVAWMAVALFLLGRWLSVAILSDTYVCTPYYESNFGVLDDGVARAWPASQRPDPFCRLVPSQVINGCATQNLTGIGELAACSGAKKVVAMSSYFHVQEQRAIPTKKPDGDCHYPYKVVDTGMTSFCPLFSDELLGHWGAMVIAIFFGLLSALAAGAIAIIFLAIGKKKPKVPKKKKVVRKRRVKRKEKKRKKKRKKSPAKTPPPPPPPPPAEIVKPAEPREPINIALQIPRQPSTPPVVMVPQPRRRRRRKAVVPPPVFLMAPPPPCLLPSMPCMPLGLMAPPMPSLMESPSIAQLSLCGVAGTATERSPTIMYSRCPSTAQLSPYGLAGSATAYPPTIRSWPSRILPGSGASSTAVNVVPSRRVAFATPSRSIAPTLVYPRTLPRPV